MSYLFYLIPGEGKSEALNREVLLNDENLEIVETVKNEDEDALSTYEDTVKCKNEEQSIAVVYSGADGNITEIGWHSAAYPVLYHIRTKYGYDWYEGDDWLYEMYDCNLEPIIKDGVEEDILWTIYMADRMAKGCCIFNENDPLKDNLVKKYGYSKIRETVEKYREHMNEDVRFTAKVFFTEGKECGKPIYEYLEDKWLKNHSK